MIPVPLDQNQNFQPPLDFRDLGICEKYEGIWGKYEGNMKEQLMWEIWEKDEGICGKYEGICEKHVYKRNMKEYVKNMKVIM